MFEELRGLGYDGGYDAVRRYGNNWREERGASTAAAYVPLSFARVCAWPRKIFKKVWDLAFTSFVAVTRARAALRRPPDPARRCLEPPEQPGRAARRAQTAHPSTGSVPTISMPKPEIPT